MLSDPNKREIYNKYGMKGLKESGGVDDFSGEDLFSNLFGGGLFGGLSGFSGFGGGRRRPQRGEDTIHQLK